MGEPLRELHEAYASALADYLAEGGEKALQRAYALGRRAVASGVGVLDMVSFHHLALARIVAEHEDPPAVIEVAGQFLAESLSPFEMTHRGYREANAALQASERRYRELFENANDVVFTVDLGGRVTSVNRAGEELSGYRRDEIMTLDFNDVVAPRYLPTLRSMLVRNLAGKIDRTRFEIEIIARDGRFIPIEVRTAPIYMDGRPVGVHGIARDITERKQAEQALRRLNERLEEEARRIAHALHDEAGQLVGSVHLALEEVAGELPPRTRKHLRHVRQLLDRIEDQLRDLSHELRPTILDDLGLLPALEFLADRVARRSGLAITVAASMDEQPPAASATALYRSVQEALANVVRHARARRVDIEISRADGAIQCSVRDDGAGFDVPATLSRRGDRGLGLIGIRERVGALGGTLAIHSVCGQGAELLITIPVQD